MQVYRRAGVLVFFACCMAAGCCGGDRTIENTAIARAYLDNIIIGRQWEHWHDYFSADMTYNGTTLAEVAMRATADGLHLAFPDLSLTITDQVAQADKVVTRIMFSGTHLGLFNTLEPSGRPVRFQAVMVDQISEGRVVSTWQQIDMWGIVRQLRARDPDALPEKLQDNTGT